MCNYICIYVQGALSKLVLIKIVISIIRINKWSKCTLNKYSNSSMFITSLMSSITAMYACNSASLVCFLLDIDVLPPVMKKLKTTNNDLDSSNNGVCIFSITYEMKFITLKILYLLIIVQVLSYDNPQPNVFNCEQQQQGLHNDYILCTINLTFLKFFFQLITH